MFWSATGLGRLVDVCVAGRLCAVRACCALLLLGRWPGVVDCRRLPRAGGSRVGAGGVPGRLALEAIPQLSATGLAAATPSEQGERQRAAQQSARRGAASTRGALMIRTALARGRGLSWLAGEFGGFGAGLCPFGGPLWWSSAWRQRGFSWAGGRLAALGLGLACGLAAQQGNRSSMDRSAVLPFGQRRRSPCPACHITARKGRRNTPIDCSFAARAAEILQGWCGRATLRGNGEAARSARAGPPGRHSRNSAP